MKKGILFLLCLLLACINQINAQWSSYTFSHRTEAFASIDSYPGDATQPFSGYIDNNIFTYLDPAFLMKNFKGFGLDIATDPTTALSFVNFYTATSSIKIITPRPNTDTTTYRNFWTNISAGFNLYCINDGDTSRNIKVKNLFDASTHDTIFVIQFSKVSPHDESFVNDPFFHNGLSTYTFQIWIHSLDNSIEFKYGPRNIVDNPTYAPAINLHLTSDDIQDDFYYTVGIGGNPNTPTFYKQFGITESLPRLTGWPPENIVYKFTPAAFPVTPPPPTAINSASVKQLQVSTFPNPISDFLHVTFGAPFTGKICMYDVLGQNMKAENLKNCSSYKIACDHFANGIYTIHFISQDGLSQTTKQVVVNH